jgi:hypothetical protein
VKKILLITSLVFAFVVPASAQNDLQERCPAGNSFCNRMGLAAELAQVRTGIGLAGGNPVAGASSTLGMRLGAIPRVTVAGRMTGVQLDVPNTLTATSSGELGNFPRSLNVDASVGVFSGMSLLPTVGGFGSIDLVASYGSLGLPDEFVQENVKSWALGVRLGILRESFTAPGVSITGMYRSIDDVQLGNTFTPNNGPGTYFRVHDTKLWSARATVGKRILMLGATAGIGWDKFTGTAQAQDGSTFQVTADDFNNSRTTIFGNLSWTMLILNIVGEGGVQRGGPDDTYYGSLAVRIAL